MFFNHYMNAHHIITGKAREVADDTMNQYLVTFPRKAAGDEATIEKWIKKMCKVRFLWHIEETMII